MDNILIMSLPKWMLKQVRFTFICENCQEKKTEWVNKRHIRQKKYCKKCQKEGAKVKFKRLHPDYNQKWKKEHYIVKSKNILTFVGEI